MSFIFSIAALAAATIPVDVPATASEEPCQVTRVEHKASDVGDLFLICGKDGLRIGPSVSFTSAYNTDLGRYLVVNKTTHGRQAFLIRPVSGDQPALVEDITSDIAAVARGEKWSRVDDLSDTIDISTFAANGIIKATGASANRSPKAGATRVAIKLGNEAGVVRAVKAAADSTTN